MESRSEVQQFGGFLIDLDRASIGRIDRVHDAVIAVATELAFDSPCALSHSGRNRSGAGLARLLDEHLCWTLQIGAINRAIDLP
jgi:hypothetical protein